jgi:hypothetical protein
MGLYSYALNNPNVFTDPTGLQAPFVDPNAYNGAVGEVYAEGTKTIVEETPGVMAGFAGGLALGITVSALTALENMATLGTGNHSGQESAAPVPGLSEDASESMRLGYEIGSKAGGVAAAFAVWFATKRMSRAPVNGRERPHGSDTGSNAPGAADDTVDLFRAVSSAEFDDIARTGVFRAAPGAFEGKQFGLTLSETLRFADVFPEAAAIMRARVPRSVFQQMDFSLTIDPFIFKSGVVTAQPGAQMRLLNQNLKLLDQAF